MTEAMPFLQKAILLSYDPWPFRQGRLLAAGWGGNAHLSLVPQKGHWSSRPPIHLRHRGQRQKTTWNTMVHRAISASSQ